MDGKSILNLLSECVFDGILTYKDVEDKIFSHLPDNFEYEWNEGASKVVIIPKNADFVIKIPYTGNVNNDKYEPFVSANSTDALFWDYCFTEVLVWRFAKIEKVHQVFAKERLIGIINEHPIYIQQRVEVYSHSDKYDSASDKERKETVDYCSKKNFEIFSNETFSWQVDALEYYGEKQFDKIMHFIKDNKIGDLHESNLGYINDKPVICDYSDFLD